MVDPGNDNAISRLEPVHAIIEPKFDASLQDQVEVDGVGVVHRGNHVRLVFDYLPVHASTAQTEVIGAGLTRGSGGRRSGPRGVNSCRPVTRGRGFNC